MHQIEKEIVWEMGHRLMYHFGKCSNLHGHSYRAIFTLQGEINPITGMVLDFYHFGKLKEHIDTKYDHGFIFNEKDPIYFNLKLLDMPKMKLIAWAGDPTAETIAESLYWEATKILTPSIPIVGTSHDCKITRVTVFETATCSASFIPNQEE